MGKTEQRVGSKEGTGNGGEQRVRERKRPRRRLGDGRGDRGEANGAEEMGWAL